MSTHTPGPWLLKRARTPSDGGWDWGIAAEFNGRNYCIAEAFEVVGPGNVKASAEANARLIASAPKLLLATKTLIECATIAAEMLDALGREHTEICVAIDLATKFVAEAEGHT